MRIANSLSIKPVAADQDQYCYECAGYIDAAAESGLGALRELPATRGSKVVLDFREVERVTSMGLTLLLKLFEEWENGGAKVQVRNLNRMISVLFKITGLGRYMEGGAAEEIAPKPMFAAAAPQARVAPDGAGGKLRFVASMQTGAQLSGWYVFNTYLQRRLQRAIGFEQLPQGELLTPEARVDLFYAKPFEACTLIRQRGFNPLLRAIGEADEVVVVARADDTRSLADFAGAALSTAAQNSFVYLLGRFLLDEMDCDSSTFRYEFAGNEIKALQYLLKERADLMLMLKKTYHGLSNLNRSATRVLEQSDTQFAFHLFCTAPYLGGLNEALTTVLKDMASDEQGSQILDDIEISGWQPPEPAEVDMLLRLYDRYGQ